MKLKKIYYWSPFLSPIATPKAVINSATSLMRYSSSYESNIINFFGEFNFYKNQQKKEKIRFVDYYSDKLVKKLPYKGKLKSRFSFIIIFLMSIFPLLKVLKKEKPDYLIIHLITSLPLIFLIFFNFKTKFILRISGLPKMNFLRKLLWKLAFKKIYLVTCPTYNTLNFIKSFNYIDSNKIKLLYDPIINVREIHKKKKYKIPDYDFFLAVGRLTHQKNFMFLCKAFKELIVKNKNIRLLIAGEGENKNQLKKFIDQNNLTQNIVLLGHKNNIFPYFKNARCFVLTSLWEDPGFVLIEASFCRVPVLTSDALPGPTELIKNNVNGIVFKNNNLKSFFKQFNNINNHSNLKSLKLNNLKLSRNFTIFNHYKGLSKLI